MKLFGLTIGEAAPSGSALVVGGHPSVDLLPDEVRIARRSRGIRRGVIAAAVLVLVAAMAGGAGSKVYSLSAEVELAIEQARTTELLAQQASFAEVVSVQAEIAERAAARRVITGTEIDWRATIEQIRATLPEGATLASVTVEGATPMAAHAQSTGPLQGPRVATVMFTARSATLLAVPDIIDDLGALPGFVDASVPSATAGEDGVETAFVVHLDEGAFADRFAAEDAADAPTEQEGGK